MTKIEALELELAARKMVEGTGLDWSAVIRHQPTKQKLANTLDVFYPENVELAINIIEGKPVWKGDRYFNGDGDMCEAFTISLPLSKAYWARCTWNPPKPKTVLVEIAIDTATSFSYRYQNLYPHRRDVEDAITNALEEFDKIYATCG